MAHPDALIDVLDEDPVPGKPLGRRLVEHDPRSRNFPMATQLNSDVPITSRHWCRLKTPFDQGVTSSCVGQSVAGLLHSLPIVETLDPAVQSQIDPYALYSLAQRFDPWEGVSYEGTSTLAGFKAARYKDYILKYRWCFGLDDVLRTLSQVGPVVIGVNWYSSFDDPGPGGVLELPSSAGSRGGHAVQLQEIDVENRYVVGPNSWGPEWGDNGYFRLPWDILDRLLAENGEACTAVVLGDGEDPSPQSEPDPL